MCIGCHYIFNHHSLLLRDAPLTFVTSFKYLGFQINSSFNDDDDIRRQMRSFYFRSNYLIRTFSRCSLQVKTMLFSACCSSLYVLCPLVGGLQMYFHS